MVRHHTCVLMMATTLLSVLSECLCVSYIKGIFSFFNYPTNNLYIATEKIEFRT